jgi:hypothetical protein
VSETVPRGQQVPADQQGYPGPESAPPALRSRRRHRGGWAAAGVLVVVAGGAAAWQAGVFSPASSGSGSQGGPPAATAAVQREDISAQTPVNATLGYAGSYSVRGHGTGTLTWLPPQGQMISQGQVLYKTGDGSPVVLLHGSVPAWRNLTEGVTGADVSQLNHDLVRLGYADRADVVALGWNYFSWETQVGVEKLQSALGVSYPTGSLSLGQVVFEPQALRVSQVTGSLGGSESGPVLTATSDQQVVTIPLDASQQSQVKAGDAVSVTLPDGQATPGVVASVGKVATTSGSGSNANTTIPVVVRLTHPQAAGSLDQAPVTVNITTGTAHDALVVPVTALLAQSSDQYVVEVVGSGNTRRYVPVTPGIFDDAHGLVEVTGALTPGERVVVPAS